MKILELKNKGLNYRQFIKRTANESDYDFLVTEPTIGIENGEVKFIYDYIDFDVKEVVDALKRIKYSEHTRSDGLKTRSRVFGFKPRVTMRADFCSSTSLATEAPTEHAIICSLAEKIEKYYLASNPKGFAEHKKMVESQIKAEYRIGSSVFTSGIINKNNPLKYHFDSGNFKKVYSCMPVFKVGVSGGHLALPEYGVGIELKDKSIFLFDGQGILHGVTPIKYDSPLSYRFSIVYYSLQQIWKCLTLTDELLRIREKKTERERNRWKMPPEHRKALEKQRDDKIARNKRNENSYSNTEQK